LNVCSLTIVLLFLLSAVLGERVDGKNWAINSAQPVSTLEVNRRLLSTSLIESEAQGSLLTCSNPAASTCAGIGPSTFSVAPGTTQTFSIQLNCAASYVYTSWSLPYGVTITVTFAGTTPSVQLSATSTASGSGVFQTEWCDSQNRHVQFQTAITVSVLETPHCGTFPACPSNQWCYAPSDAAPRCVNFAKEGEDCLAPGKKCQDGLVCQDVCISPRLPCLYHGASPCAVNTIGATSFVANGQNNTFQVAIDSACTPVTYISFSSSYSWGVNFYYDFPPNAVAVTVNDLTKGGTGSVTVEFCDKNSLYVKKDAAFDFNK